MPTYIDTTIIPALWKWFDFPGL